MIGRLLFKRLAERRAAQHRSRALLPSQRWNAPEPIKLGIGFVLVNIGVLLELGCLLNVFFAQRGNVTLGLIFSTGLLLFGCVWLFIDLGQQIAGRLRGLKKRCGYCRSFEVSSALHVIGRCQADPSKPMVSRTDGCRSFCFSERALARDRLGQHPGVLKQLQITRISDTPGNPKL